MIRPIILLICLLPILPLLTRAQIPLDHTAMDNARQLSLAQHQTFDVPLLPHKKWQLSTFGGISGSYGFLNRTNASFLSAPVTLQLTHPLSRNLYAFAAVSAAPAYYHFSTFFLQPHPDKFSASNRIMGVHPFGWYSRAEAGLFYINDEKTFSISGSIFMDRSSYPLYVPVTQQRIPTISR
jgi:hypothetical protein